MSSSSWDDMKRVREEEYFMKEEQAKVAALKAKRSKEQAYLQNTHAAIEKFQRGYSPISGANLFKAKVGAHTVLDAPEEGVLLLPYDTLVELLTAATSHVDSEMVTDWKRFLDVALNNHRS